MFSIKITVGVLVISDQFLFYCLSHFALERASLEFNAAGHLFPAIHPVYEKTLVGKVIGLLDYMMKGYLNGGAFHESFIMDWETQEDWNTTSALGEMVAFREYCLKNLPEENQCAP